MKEKIQQWIRYHAIKRWLERYERWLMPATLVGGSILDFITFANINISTTFLLLGAYVILATICIAFAYLYDGGRVPANAATKYIRIACPYVVQFTFGALLSGTFVFYFFSGTVFVSWPIIALLAVLMVSNEMLRSYYLRPSVQIGVYFFVVLSFVSVLLPFALRSIDAWVFVLSSAVGVLYIIAFAGLMVRAVPSLRSIVRPLGVTVVVTVTLMQTLYALNSIPPVPLTLRDSALAHSLTRLPRGYALTVEKRSWKDRLLPGETVHLRSRDRLYVYTAIFAPRGLDTTAVHHWQFFDESVGGWVTRDRLSYGMIGGNTAGYYGYSYWTGLTPGRWRVDVETPNQRVVGRVQFRVERVDEAPEVVQVVK